MELNSDQRRFPRWMDRDSEFVLVDSGTPLDVDGHKLDEPVGEVLCLGCYRAAPSIEEIVHAEGCDNAEREARRWRS